MNKILLAGAFALLATSAFAAPYCNVDKQPNGQPDYGFGPVTEDEAAQRFEQELHAAGIDAHQTRFWNGCIQTFVSENGKDVMKFYDPDSLSELPAN